MHIYAINKSHVLAHMIEEMHDKINKVTRSTMSCDAGDKNISI